MIDISCESSARQRIHMMYQVLFYMKNEKKRKKRNRIYLNTALKVDYSIYGSFNENHSSR